MSKAIRDPGRREVFSGSLLAACLLGGTLAVGVEAQTPPDMANTKHNLSVSGPGPVRALTETRICIFCHTPHNSTPLSPLWNKELQPQTYTVYDSPTLKARPLPQPSGPTKLCLSCHDGTIATGAVVNPAGGISMSGSGELPPGSPSNFGLDISGHHPASFPYHTSLPNADLVSPPPPELVYGGTDEVHCTTCHDPHNDQYGKFLAKDNRSGGLCTTCHLMAGWSSSVHATSTASVAGILPRPPKTWPKYTQLKEWACESCHTPHFAATGEQLLNFTDAPAAPFSCLSCHDAHAEARGGTTGSGDGGMVDIARQTRKASAHPEASGGARRGREIAGDVVCTDCHDPHTTGVGEAEAPFASGLLRGVSGVDRNGAKIATVTYEYEVCFKCHADNTPDLDHVPRVLSITNTRLAFDPANPSYHPVLGVGRNLNVPSIPSAFEPGMRPSDVIYCTACHADDEGGSRGPHGSSFTPILKQRYETTDNTPESHDNYALCYQCHDRSSILRDASFRKKSPRATASGGGHSGHLAAGAPCSACHDPHGVNVDSAAGAVQTGSHTHLINFDTRIVLPNPGSPYPVFRDTGTFSGSCDLLCHGVAHDNAAYP